MSTKLLTLLEQSLPLKLELSLLENAKGCALANTMYVYFSCNMLCSNDPYRTALDLLH